LTKEKNLFTFCSKFQTLNLEQVLQFPHMDSQNLISLIALLIGICLYDLITWLKLSNHDWVSHSIGCLLKFQQVKEEKNSLKNLGHEALFLRVYIRNRITNSITPQCTVMKRWCIALDLMMPYAVLCANATQIFAQMKF
jgi:hypothetical protein